jgi:predicted nucleotidyltransferase component of viral defense system
MIGKDEIQEKAREFGIHVANVQRDYVFGWILSALYSETALRDVLILKGGNCFRKAYFPSTRFSNDLDFSTESALDEELVLSQFNRACEAVQARTGVTFDVARNQIRIQSRLDEKRRVFDLRVYFQDFYGHADHITIRLSIDITEFDKIYLPIQQRRIIHPYSDVAECSTEIRCLKLEEMIANKLKCLLQRRHVPDVYDLVYSTFINRHLAVDRGEVISTFLRKTIYERSPGVARQLLLDLPLLALKVAWERYIVAPVQGTLDFDDAIQRFQVIIGELFAGYGGFRRAALAYFPSNLRSPIMEAGSDRRLMRLTYDGISRIVEPYSLSYKQRKDGRREEYFYVWDRTGGRNSGPGLKALLNQKIQNVQILDEKFEPRYAIELGKAGELSARGYFGSPFGGGRSTVGSARTSQRPSTGRLAALRRGWRYIVRCPYCSRIFKRMRRSTGLRTHRDGYGNSCPGRRGAMVGQEFA